MMVVVPTFTESDDAEDEVVSAVIEGVVGFLSPYMAD